MGANEKHAATYHGEEYTPTRAQIGQALECAYIESSELEEVLDNIQAMLAKVRAEAKAEALEEAADWVRDNGGDLVSRGIEEELTYRANQYKETQ